MKINYKSFSQFFTLSFGSILSLLINVLVLVIFSRIYSKENFGDYAIFVSVTSLLAIIATFRIEHLIVLKKTIKEAAFLSKVCKQTIRYFTFFVVVVMIFLYVFSVPFFNLNKTIWLFIPIPVFCLSQIIVFLSWNNKIKNYILISRYKILQSITVGVTGYICHFFYKDVGLIYAYILGLIISFVMFQIHFNKFISKFNFNVLGLETIIKTFIENKKYIKNSFGLEFFNTVGKYIPNFILNAYYGNAIVGVYDMTLKVLNIPKNIISLNIGELYYQKASTFYHKSYKKFSKITLQTFYTLLITGIVCYLPFVFFGKELFVFVLGKKWQLSGEFSQIISLWILLLFITSPMAYIFYIRKTLATLFWFILGSFIVKTSVLFYFSTLQNESLTIYNYTYFCIIIELFLVILILKQRSKTIKT